MPPSATHWPEKRLGAATVQCASFLRCEAAGTTARLALAPNLARGLVFARAQVRGVADVAAAGPLAEADLDDHLGLHPHRVLRCIARIEGLRLAHQRFEQALEAVELGFAEASPHLARVVQRSLVVVVADQQRADAAAASPLAVRVPA